VGGPLHNSVTAALSIVLIAIGVAIVISTVARGGGPAAYGVIVGFCFMAAGGARLWLVLKGPGRDG